MVFCYYGSTQCVVTRSFTYFQPKQFDFNGFNGKFGKNRKIEKKKKKILKTIDIEKFKPILSQYLPEKLSLWSRASSDEVEHFFMLISRSSYFSCFVICVFHFFMVKFSFYVADFKTPYWVMSVLLATAELLLMANFFFTEKDSHQHLNGIL